MKKKVQGMMALTVLVVFGAASLAFAGWGMGSGYMGSGNWGPGVHRQGGYGCGPGCGYHGNLSTDELARLDQERTEYFKATEDIRQKLYAKELELRGELAKDNPDSGHASKLQREISGLRNELDQKSLDYELKASQAVPNYRRGHGGYGSMMGHGPRGGGYCMW